MAFVDRLECSRCGDSLQADRLANTCPKCESPLLVRYDLHEIKRNLKKTDLLDRPSDMWRYLEVLPVLSEQEIVSLGEGFTALLPLHRLGQDSGFSRLYLKDEALNPTGSFKARGLSAAVSMARKLGAEQLCIPTAGNAGGALAAYAARAGVAAHVFMPRDTPQANYFETLVAGAQVVQVDGLISDAARLMQEQMRQNQWFDCSTLKEPYRIEGKKTMGLELAEQFGWTLPDVIVYPTGGGTGLIGMWKAFQELDGLGWIDSQRPRMVSVQASGCAPIVKAFHEGADTSQFWEGAATFSSGLRVPKALGDFLILSALRESQGTAVAVSDEETYQAILEVGAREGIFLCPEGATCWAAVKKLRKEGWLSPDQSIVLFNTGAGHKYLDSIRQFEETRGGKARAGLEA